MTIYFNDLNDDCLRTIICLLNFRDQMLLSQASTRFQYLIELEWNWKGACQKISLSDYFWRSSKTEAYFPKFISIVSFMVEEIELNTYHLERWGPLLRKIEFAKVKSCTASISQSYTNTDDQVLLIAECFPQLGKLTLRGHITGKNIWEFKKLNELHFDVHDIKLKTRHIRQSYKKLPLKKLTLFSEDHRTSCGFSKAIDPLYLCYMLEELRVAGDIVNTAISKIKKAKNLQKITVGALLSFRFIPYPLEDIGAHFGSKVESVVFNHVIRDRADHLKGLESMTNLRKIVLYEDSITSEQLRFISIQLGKTLEEFCYLKCGRSLEDVEKFLFLITNCSRLKILDVSGTSVDLKLINRISDLLIKQDRVQTLLLRCGNTKIIPSEVEKLKLPESFQLSFEKHEIDLPDEYFFQVTLKKDTV